MHRWIRHLCTRCMPPEQFASAAWGTTQMKSPPAVEGSTPQLQLDLVSRSEQVRQVQAALPTMTRSTDIDTGMWRWLFEPTHIPQSHNTSLSLLRCWCPQLVMPPRSPTARAGCQLSTATPARNARVRTRTCINTGHSSRGSSSMRCVPSNSKTQVYASGAHSKPIAIHARYAPTAQMTGVFHIASVASSYFWQAKHQHEHCHCTKPVPNVWIERKCKQEPRRQQQLQAVTYRIHLHRPLRCSCRRNASW